MHSYNTLLINITTAQLSILKYLLRKAKGLSEASTLKMVAFLHLFLISLMSLC